MSRWPTISAALSALTAATLLAACGTEAPFVLSDYRQHQRGSVVVCFDDDTSTVAQAMALAEDICRQYDRTAKLHLVQPNQCSWTTPSQATFLCVARPGESPPPISPHLAPMRHDTPLPAD
ncbi:hypothetical protein [Telmatospirillum sp.]|uniref:hypothetical protein n=1 Tax=Telmatospirillum sp. TaxID=2079197 RepID=UPI00284DF366|nr:hypothetical protein [Telmatospirillum sp.]MDR3441083.1 hypothetical protein [Telmatospirillum sp.]